jgi:hypothetical protein
VISDKNSLFDRGSIGEVGLCVKKNKSQYMGVLGYAVARRIVRDAREGALRLSNVRGIQKLKSQREK